MLKTVAIRTAVVAVSYCATSYTLHALQARKDEKAEQELFASLPATSRRITISN